MSQMDKNGIVWAIVPHPSCEHLMEMVPSQSAVVFKNESSDEDHLNSFCDCNYYTPAQEQWYGVCVWGMWVVG